MQSRYQCFKYTMYKNTSTDQELLDAAAYVPSRCCVCTHQMAALFCVWNDAVASSWTYDIISKNPTWSINTYLPVLEEQLGQIWFHLYDL